MERKAMNERGVIYTFYSYKGGVGRSMALANTAALLAEWGKRVLVVDWDLEAPGIERYFDKYFPDLSGQRKITPGIVDMIYGFGRGTEIDWHECLLSVSLFGSEYPSLSVLSAGKENHDYVSHLQKLDWELLFNERQLGNYLEKIREEWIAEYDFILIDSRTGITDIGGICTIYLPDILVLFFTANHQSLDGVIDVMRRARNSRNHLPFDRSYLVGVPVPSRDESMTEYAAAKEWRKIFATKLSDLYQDWLQRDNTPEDALKILRIPYIPYWSFGEQLPVVEEGTDDPKSLGFSYKFLAKLLANRLQWDKALKENKTVQIDDVKKHTGHAEETKIRIFISYPKEDITMARRLSEDLEYNGFPTWFDEKDILPGQNRRLTIKRAIKNCTFLIILLSDRSVTKKGFIQAEQKLVYDEGSKFIIHCSVTKRGFVQAEQKLVYDEGTEISIIPVRINDCEIPYGLEGISGVDLFPDYEEGLRQILIGLNAVKTDAIGRNFE